MNISELFGKIKKSIPLLVGEAEKAMKDGRISEDERKPLVKRWIEIIADQFEIKLKWYHWLILSWLINMAASKLPSKDIVLPPIVSVKF